MPSILVLTAGGGVTSPLLKDFSDNVFTDRRVNKEIRIVETYDNDGSFYRLYSDGFCIQGGTLSCKNDAVTTVTLVKTMRDTNYMVFVTMKSYHNISDWGDTIGATGYTTNTLRIFRGHHGSTASKAMPICWQVSGYST